MIQLIQGNIIGVERSVSDFHRPIHLVVSHV